MHLRPGELWLIVVILTIIYTGGKLPLLRGSLGKRPGPPARDKNLGG